MAAAIEKSYGVTPDLKMGSDGVFDVVIDGDKVFSKWDEGRFPENSEILDEIADRKRKAGTG